MHFRFSLAGAFLLAFWGIFNLAYAEQQGEEVQYFRADPFDIALTAWVDYPAQTVIKIKNKAFCTIPLLFEKKFIHMLAQAKNNATMLRFKVVNELRDERDIMPYNPINSEADLKKFIRVSRHQIPFTWVKIQKIKIQHRPLIKYKIDHKDIHYYWTSEDWRAELKHYKANRHLLMKVAKEALINPVKYYYLPANRVFIPVDGSWAQARG